MFSLIGNELVSGKDLLDDCHHVSQVAEDIAMLGRRQVRSSNVADSLEELHWFEAEGIRRGHELLSYVIGDSELAPCLDKFHELVQYVRFLRNAIHVVLQWRVTQTGGDGYLYADKNPQWMKHTIGDLAVDVGRFFPIPMYPPTALQGADARIEVREFLKANQWNGLGGRRILQDFRRFEVWIELPFSLLGYGNCPNV